MDFFSFKTLKQPAEDFLLKDKGSKFIGYANRVDTEEDFKNYLEKIKKLHPKATHHCYAFRLGMSGDNYRANDDGEPSGSAGLPIYNQILGKDLTNSCVIVVRYYGGTKLGVSGLVKAYKNCASGVLDSAEFTIEELTFNVKLTFKFEQQNEIFNIIYKFNGKILEFDAAEKCVITAVIKLELQEEFLEKVKELHHVIADIS